MKHTVIKKSLYDGCNRLFKDNENCFYTEEEIKKLKRDKTNIWL